jgi:hypothetical protein
MVALTHLQALALVALAGIGLALILRRSIVLSAVALSGGLVAIVPWLDKHLRSDGQFLKVPWANVYHSPSFKVGKLFAYTFDHFPQDPEVWAPAFAFTVAIAGPVVLGALVRRAPGQAPPRAGAAALWVFLSCTVLYTTLPYEIRGPVVHLYNYPRYATFVLMTLALLPRPDLRGVRVLAIAPAVVAALWMDATVAGQLRRFSQNASPFLAVIRAVKPGSRVLPLMMKDTDPACAYDPYNQFHAYLTAATKSYDPYLFDNDSSPLLYTASTRIPAPRWANAAREVSVQLHAPLFDYVLVQGLEGDPFAPGGRLGRGGVHMVAEGGIWRLYAFDRPRGSG